MDPRTCSNLFKLTPAPTPTALIHMFKLVHLGPPPQCPALFTHLNPPTLTPAPPPDLLKVIQYVAHTSSARGPLTFDRNKCLFVYFTPMMPGCSPCESPWFRFRLFPDCLAISTFISSIFIIDNSKLTMVCQEWQYKRFWLCQ